MSKPTQKKSATKPKAPTKPKLREPTLEERFVHLSRAVEAGLQDRQAEYVQALQGQRRLGNVINILVGLMQSADMFTEEEFRAEARKQAEAVINAREAAIEEVRKAKEEGRDPKPTAAQGKCDVLANIVNEEAHKVQLEAITRADAKKAETTSSEQD